MEYALMRTRTRALALVLVFLIGSVLGAPLARVAFATITCSITNTFANQSGPTIPLSQLDANFTNLNACYSGLVAALTDLPLTRAYTGTQRWAKGTDITDSATLTIPSDGNYFVAAGTTTVTAISTLEAGTQVMFRFSGARTLTHNATTLILLGATNATTAAGDLYWFVSEGGGNWREVWRRPVTSASSTTFFNGAGAWSTPAGSSFQQVGTSDTEATTTSTTIVDLRAFSSLTIANTSTIRVVLNWRKTTGAVNGVRVGLKLNTTDLYSAPSLVSTATNQIESGVVEFVIPPRTSASYPKGVIRYTSNSIAGTITNDTPDGTMPTVTITDLIIRGYSDNGAVTLGINNVRVFIEG